MMMMEPPTETEEENRGGDEDEGLTLNNKRRFSLKDRSVLLHNSTHPEEGDGVRVDDVDPSGSEEEEEEVEEAGEEGEDHPGQVVEEVEGEREAGKGRVYVTGSNGRNVNRDGGCSSKPLRDGSNALVLDLVSSSATPPGKKEEEEADGRKCLVQEERPVRDGVSRVSSDGDHLLLNGFTESPERRRFMESLEDGVAGAAEEAVMAAPPVVLSSDVDHRSVWAGEDGSNGGDGDRDTPGADCVDTESLLPCELGKHPGRNCAGSTAKPFPVPNGEVDDSNCCLGPGGDAGSPSYDPDWDAQLSEPWTNAESETAVAVGGCLCDADGKETIKLANGGLHLPDATGAAAHDHPSSPSSSSDSEECFSQNRTNVPFDVVCVVQRDSNRQPPVDGESPEEGVAPADEEPVPTTPRLSLPTSSLVEEEEALDPSSKEGPPAPTLTPDDLSAKPPSSCPSTLSNLTIASRGAEPSPGGGGEEEEGDEEVDSEEEEGYADFSLPLSRPQSLRTSNLPGITVSHSLSCDATPLSPEQGGGEGGGAGGFYFGGEEGFEAGGPGGRRQSAPDNLAEQSDASSEHKLMPKRFGIADFFTRSLFTRKAKEPKVPPCQNATGWRLFGKTAKEDGASSPTSQQEEQLKASCDPPCSQRPPVAVGKRRNLEFEPLSTTALILEDRPPNLPAKCVEEAQRHKQEYEEMVAGAKRREMKEAQKKKRQMKERYRQEESIAHAIHIWNNEILPHWDSVKGSRRVRDLWWNGLPPSVRGRVWSLAIANELNITPELYEIFLSRAKEKCRSYSETSSVNDSESEGASLADRESSLDLIKLDISRTFPSLFIFQKGGPYHDLLHSILGAYTCYRPDIGYVQGMSFIAAVLILNLEEAEAFITFANLLNKPCQMAFFRVDHELMLKYFAAFEVFFEENLPHLFNHFQTNSLTPDLYLIDWIFTLYSKSLPLDVACRVWDVFCRDGEESLFRVGLGILRLYGDVLLHMDFIHIAQFLSRLPQDLASDTLFTAMANTHMVSGNRRWGQVFSALMKDTNKDTDKSNNSPALRS